MPIIEISILSVLLQIFCIVHIMRTGRSTIWIWIVILTSYIGMIAYFIVEIWPELGNSHAVRAANKVIVDKIDPHREIKQHTDALQVADTVDNTLNLAQALKEKGLYDDALALYAKAQTGMYKNDPFILLGKAEAFYKKSDFESAKTTLEDLIRENPDFKSAEGHLLYAKALEGAGFIDKAKEEYVALCGYYAGPEPKCHYARLLKTAGEDAKANELYAEVITAANRNGKHYSKLHQEWIDAAKRG